MRVCAFQCNIFWTTQKKFAKVSTYRTFQPRTCCEKRIGWKLVRSSYETKKEENTLQTEELLNPSRVAFLEREYKQLLQNYEQTWDEDKKKAIQVKLKKVERNLELEKRSLMTRGLRNVFIAQAVFSLIVGGLLASNKFPYIADVPLVLRALGFWMVWLFTIPSLRARKPVAAEKNALNVAFVVCPLANIVIPFVNKDTFLLWSVNVFLIVSLYAYYFLVKDAPVAMRIRGIWRFLDWGSWK